MVLHLDQTFKPLAGQEIVFESFTFHGGEPHIRIQPFDIKQTVHLTHRINSFNDLGLLCIAVDALRRMGVESIELVLPYFPAARQDRVMVSGESLTVKVYADLINNLNLSRLTILDPHSDVAPALLHRCKVLTNFRFIEHVLPRIPSDFILISPDAGASKKIYQLATHLNHTKVLECTKKRNVHTGKLSGFTVPSNDLEGKACLIVDDICDGGGTFLGLGEELKNKNAGDLFLAVSHGIFSKGYEQLNNLYSKIFTTDSIKSIDDPNVHQITISQII